MSDPNTPAGAQGAVPGANLALGLITIALFFNYLDRYLLGILIVPIKDEFKLTDTEVGLLLGAAFAFLYAGLAIPIARLADRFNRVQLLAASAAVWSAAIASCGLATNFVHLLLSRMGLGCGEAGALPPAHSMVADYFPPRRRSTAMAVMALSASAGVAAAPLLGGVLDTLLGWRWTFVVIGIPGIGFAIALPFLLQEPVRGASDGLGDPDAGASPFIATISTLWNRRAFRLLTAVLALMSLTEYALFLWLAPLFSRTLHLPSDELGRQLFMYQGIPYMIGTIAGGLLSDRLYALDKRWIAWIPAISIAIAAPAVLALCLSDGSRARAMIVVPSFVMGSYVGPCFATIQGLASVRSRATAVAFLVFVNNVIGAGIGPWLIGALSDHLHDAYGESSLRYSLLSLVPLYLIAAALLVRVGRHLEDGLMDAARESRLRS